jgi:membrane protein implicated in regulation of membrane protease activity
VTLLVALVLAFTVLPEPWGLVAVGTALVLELGEAWLLWRWSRRRRPVVGLEAFVGASATAVTPCAPRGQVRIQGETWAAVTDDDVDVGGIVEVVGVDADGLTLRVTPG